MSEKRPVSPPQVKTGRHGPSLPFKESPEEVCPYCGTIVYAHDKICLNCEQPLCFTHSVSYLKNEDEDDGHGKN